MNPWDNSIRCLIMFTIAVLLLGASNLLIAQSVPGKELRCADVMQRCLESESGQSGAAMRCRNAYEKCIQPTSKGSNNYRQCMANARTPSDKKHCQEQYYNTD